MPLRDINPHSSVDYAWDYPDNRSKRIRLLLEGVPLPQTIDMMAIGVQPPVKVAVSLDYVFLYVRADQF